MASIALKISDEFESIVNKLPWVNWSEIAREELLKDVIRDKALRKLDELFKDSKLTDADCLKLGRQLKQDMLKRLKAEGKL